MGNVSADKILTSQEAGEGTSPASEPKMSRFDSTYDVATASKYAPSGYPAHSSNSTYPISGRYVPPSPLNMSNMAYSLPNHQSLSSPFEHQHLIHPYPSGHPQGLVYPIQSVGHYSPNNGGSAPYAVPYAPGYGPYPMQHPGSVPHAGHYQYVANSPMQNMGPGQGPTYVAGYHHPGYTTPSRHGSLSGTTSMRHLGSQSRQGSVSQGPPAVTMGCAKRDTDKRVIDGEYDVSKTIVDGSNPMKLAQASSSPTDPASLSQSVPPAPSTPRGPPRKPKQSGHALWVGNLPPGASVVDLKDHFSQDATNNIESVFLISKSNCAFVNYKTAAACATALARFHDSRFQGVRLVCRLRKGFTAPGSGLGLGVVGSGTRSRAEETTDPSPDAGAGKSSENTIPAPLADGEVSRSLDRYFIVKSLTVEDLELSKQSGIWATQTHNETNLNHAFENTDHVYLIFSANKSGEYFGYARMLSPISDDEELALEVPPRPEPLPGTADELEVTTTAATATAPKGRIIDDSARGTIFWEVESSEDEHDEGGDEKNSDGTGAGAGPGPPSVPGPVIVDDEEVQSFGKPFRIQWLSTERVPFHRTRGLRNPWNANREVKIARDGTEIEPSVGRKLIALFHLP